MRNRNSATAAAARIVTFCFAIALTLSCAAPGDEVADPQAAADAIQQQIANYAAALDAADIPLASQVWHTSGDISFITPAGHYRGWDEVKKVYEFFGAAFSERKLTVRDISVHVYGDLAWSEFYWHFDAKQSSDGTAVQTDGRATQIHRRSMGTAGCSFTSIIRACPALHRRWPDRLGHGSVSDLGGYLIYSQLDGQAEAVTAIAEYTGTQGYDSRYPK